MSVDPEIALVPPSSAWADILAVCDLGFRLYRRVIEIEEGRLALRAHLDPNVVRVAYERGRKAGVVGEDLDAMVEAMSLAAAMRAKALGLAPAGANIKTEVVEGDDLDSEIAFLTKVARNYAKLIRKS